MEFIFFALLMFIFEIFPIIIGITIIILLKKNKKKKELKIEKMILQYDPNFNMHNFKENAVNCIGQLYQAIAECDDEKLMVLESKELFDMHKNDIKYGIFNNSLNIFDVTKISKLSITDFKVDGNKEVINAHAWIRAIKLHIKPKSKKINIGLIHVFNTRIEFIRSIYSKTKKGKDFSLHECPNCGAMIEINSSGKCIYCNSMLINGEHSWIINKIT